VIWDTAGNVWEWVRFTSAGTLDSGIAGNSETNYNLKLLPAQPNIATNWYELNNTSNYSNTGGTGALLSIWFATSGTYSLNPSTFSLGRIYILQNTTGKAVRRGSDWSAHGNAGVFSANLELGSGSDPTNDKNHRTGFRCAFNP
jgi:hypothetical protein